MTDTQTAARLEAFIHAVLTGDLEGAKAIAVDMRAEDRQAVDRLHAVVQLARLERAGGRVQ